MRRGALAWIRRLVGGTLLVCACVVAPAPAATSVQDLGWGKAVPISTRAPSWFTPGLYRRVVAAGVRGVPLSALRLRSGGGGAQSKGAGAASSACLYSSGSGPTGTTVPATPNGVERPPVGIGPGTWLISLFCT